MKHIIILGDGMADHPIGRLNGLTPLQAADTPYMDLLARRGRTGRLTTIPDGFHPGSEVANTAILGYDLNQVYEGRGPLEAASIGYELGADDLALRCNLITLTADGKIKNHHGGHLTTAEGGELINFLQARLGNDKVEFVAGIQYRHLLVVHGGSKYIETVGPHDHPNEPWRPLRVRPMDNAPEEPGRMTAAETAQLLNDLIEKSQQLLPQAPLNQQRNAKGEDVANSIWPWGGGYRPAMKTLHELYPEVSSGAVISAVDLIKGIGHYAGLDIVNVPRATGLADTNYEGKVEAALTELYNKDFVFLHFEATDEAGHDGDLELKMRAIEYLDHRVVEPIYREVRTWQEPVAIAVMPDHPTPVEIRTHVKEPVPFLVWHRGIEPDSTMIYDEASCVSGGYGMLRLSEFMQTFMALKAEQ